MNGTSPKLPTTPPLPLSRHFPQRGQQGPRLPSGGAVEQSETEGVWFVEWHQLKVTDYTPFAANAARNRGMIATGNHYYLDSLRGAPPPKGAAREPRLPGGGAVEQSETEGVPSGEWHQPKVTNATPFAAVAALPPKGAARVGQLTVKTMSNYSLN